MGDKALHFLVVEDDDESRETLVEYLKSMGYERITTAQDGSDAIRLLDHDPTINFVVSDWDMPLLNGLQLLQRVRSKPSRAHVPFLIVTSPVSEEAEKVILAGENMVDGYLIKPFRAQTLKDKISQLLDLSVHGPQKQVLVVDDDPDAREMTVEYLRKFGFKDIVGLKDGHAALDVLRARGDQIGMIISDWEMPHISGIELLKACKNNPVWAEIPFLMVTSQSSMERMKVMQAAKAQVDQYLLKPFSSAQIKQRVEAAIQRHRHRSEVQELLAHAVDHVDHGRYQSAESAYAHALNLDPENDELLRGMADVLVKIRGVEVSLPYYKRAVEFGSSNAKNFLKLALAYESTGLVDKGIATLQLGMQGLSYNPDMHFHLGRLYNKKGMISEARAEFEKTLELQLDHREARLMLEMLGAQEEES